MRTGVSKVHNYEMLEWSDLRHFLAVARSGSTLAAAKVLAVSQSTVLRRISALESQLGRGLVQRHATGYRLTKLGAELRPFAERMEECVADLERHVAAGNPDLVGKVRVACPATAAHRIMKSGLLDAFQARHSGLRVEFVMTEEFVDLAKGEADLAIRQGAPQDRALVARKIADVPWAVFASGAYLKRHGRPSRPEDIQQHRVVEFDGLLINHAAAQWMRSVAPNATSAARGNSVPEVLLAVKSGVALAPLPVPVAAGDSDLIRVIDSRPELSFPFFLVMHRDMKRTPRVRAFLDFVTDELKSFRETLSGKTRGATPTSTRW